jgi:catechol 2,3-dioxygenase-like lactoylglutathione lyase family enzyme
MSNSKLSCPNRSRVVPTTDLGTSLAFYTDVLGARFNRLVNVNLRGLNREVPEMAFFRWRTTVVSVLRFKSNPFPRRSVP